MKLVAAKCPNCNGSIEVDATKEAGVCKYCKSAFVTQKALESSNVNIGQNITQNFFGSKHAGNTQEVIIKPSDTPVPFSMPKKQKRILQIGWTVFAILFAVGMTCLIIFLTSFGTGDYYDEGNWAAFAVSMSFFGLGGLFFLFLAIYTPRIVVNHVKVKRIIRFIETRGSAKIHYVEFGITAFSVFEKQALTRRLIHILRSGYITNYQLDVSKEMLERIKE